MYIVTDGAANFPFNFDLSAFWGISKMKIVNLGYFWFDASYKWTNTSSSVSTLLLKFN